MERWESVVATYILVFFSRRHHFLSMDIHHELRAIHQEYKSYFPECELHLHNDATVPDDDLYARALKRKSPLSHIKLKTDEDASVLLTVSVAGWHELANKNLFPTFEALLNDKSPGFRNRFASELTSKLTNLT